MKLSQLPPALLVTVCVALPLSPSLARAAEANRQQRPNILFCLADDHSWPHTGACGDPVVKTPAFDRVARNGILFNYCFSAAPSCTPSRAAMLTGQDPHRLEDGANLWGKLDQKHAVYPDLLEKAGYAVGFTGKGWAPGNVQAGGRTRNPAGPEFKDFATFIASVPAGTPFCFWYGSRQPHRPYVKGSGTDAGLQAAKVTVPPIWPDVPEVRNDILDYYSQVQEFDRGVSGMLKLLEEAGKLENTIVVITGDNGWPFPRAKANLYDAGTRQPLAVQWPAGIKAGQVSDDFINLVDLAPTFLEAAGLKPLPEMTGHSFLGLLTGTEAPGGRNQVFFERERHANVRNGDLGYPCRAVRTREFLYLRNLAPDRWPAGDPEKWKSVGPFGDCDNSPTKQFILEHRSEPGITNLYRLAFEKRPAEELYELKHDPYQTNNLAGQPRYEQIRQSLRAQLDRWMKASADPRVAGDDGRWERMRYYGPAEEPGAPSRPRKKKAE